MTYRQIAEQRRTRRIRRYRAAERGEVRVTFDLLDADAA
jgi:hypothetical protein